MKGVTGDDDPGVAIAFEPSHRAEPCLESAVVSFDPVVGVLALLVPCVGDELRDHGGQRR